jgi:trimethylamine--corrinoid protein Co-methyltransferase
LKFNKTNFKFNSIIKINTVVKIINNLNPILKRKITMKMNCLEVLTKQEIQEIHNSTIELLETVGIIIESPEARDLFKKNGATIEQIEKEYFVKIPEEVLLEQLKNVPKEFSLFGPDGSFNFKVTTKNLNFSTFGAAVNIYDPKRKKKIRKTKLKDAIDQIRVVNALDNIACSGLDVWPSDVPFTELHCYTLREWARHSYKPFGLGCYGKIASQDMINIASIVVGGEKELIKSPRLIGIFNPTSPLRLTHLLLNGILIFAKYKQPLNITSSASAGSTAPVTLAGILTQGNMEILTSIILAQMVNPGTPVFYGSTNTIMDPSTGNIAYGSMEMGLITIAAAQLAHFYNIPSKGSGALTDSKCFDIQNGFERSLGLFFAVNAGHNYITCAGTYESSLSETLELLVIDDELAGIIKRGLEGINVNKDTIASEEIKKVMTSKKNYLGTKHSVKNTRREIYVPKLVDRNRRGPWLKNGAKDIMTRAKEKVEKILESQQGPGLPSDIETKLSDYFKIVASRSLNDYRKLEGMEDSEEGVDIAGFKIE